MQNYVHEAIFCNINIFILNASALSDGQKVKLLFWNDIDMSTSKILSTGCFERKFTSYGMSWFKFMYVYILKFHFA